MTTNSLKEIKSITYLGLVINLILVFFKITIGFLNQSQSLIADGFHSLSDFITDIFIIVGAKFWSAPPDSEHPYGHQKIESMISILIGASLTFVALELIYKAMLNLYSPPVERSLSSIKNTLFIALFSIFIKECLFHFSIKVGKKIRSSAVIANAWHHRSDALSSIPVALSIILSYIFPQWTFLDPLATIIVGIFLLQTTWKIISPAFNDLLEHSANEEVLAQIEILIRQNSAVCDVHKIRTRSISGTYYVDLHIQVDPHLDVFSAHEISNQVKKSLLDSNLNIIDVLIHIEPYTK